jgi:hypothetical protein
MTERTPMSLFFSWTVMTRVATMLNVDTATMRPMRERRRLNSVNGQGGEEPAVHRPQSTTS